MTPTAVFDPGSPEAEDLAEANLLGRIMLDDGRNAENPDPALHPDGDVFTLDHRFRGGDTLAGVTGVLDFAFGDYRVQPTADAEYTEVNERPAEPESGRRQRQGRVLQRPELLHDAHGARRARRQHAGGVRAPAGEDHRRDHRDRRRRRRPDRDREQRGGARRTSSTGLNDGDGARALRLHRDGRHRHGRDQGRVRLPAGARHARRRARDPRLERSTRGSSTTSTGPRSPRRSGTTTPAASSPRWSTTSSRRARTATPSAIRTRATAPGTATSRAPPRPRRSSTGSPSDPTGSGDDDFLIIGDLNSYDKEDPIDALLAGGYTDLIREFQGENAYSYVFDGHDRLPRPRARRARAWPTR